MYLEKEGHITAGKVALGRMLYYDVRFSRSQKISCLASSRPGRRPRDRRRTGRFEVFKPAFSAAVNVFASPFASPFQS